MASDDKKFSYEPYIRNVYATHDELTAFAKIIADPDSNYVKLIINAVRILALAAIFWIRWRMFDEEQRIGKQIYERKRSEKNEDDLDKDPLDAPRRDE